jgi:hypothetical protein
VCPPEIELDDGGRYKASKAQCWLWGNHLDFWQTVERIRDAERARLICGFNGDMTEGEHHGSTQVLSGNPTAQAMVVNEVMRAPLALGPDALLFIRGTEAHVGKSACAEERIADGLRRDKRPVISDDETGNASHWHKKLEIDGVRLDWAHHGRVGTRPWTKPNVVANLAAEIFYDHAKDGEPHPHIAIRSHMHQFVDTGTIHPVRVIQTPAWQLATAFIHRIAPGKLADIGGVILLIKDGVPQVIPALYKPSRSPAWRPS